MMKIKTEVVKQEENILDLGKNVGIQPVYLASKIIKTQLRKEGMEKMESGKLSWGGMISSLYKAVTSYRFNNQ